MDLPTYTNIWRIEKRLYKLYDLRLPMPLPLGQIAAFVGITVPYVLFLTLIGVTFNHNLFWLYVLPPWALTWLATRPVLENKKLPELLISQVRYLGEPRVWCRMSPPAEKDEIVVTGRVWHARRQPVTEQITQPAVETAGQAAPARALVPLRVRARTAQPQTAQPQTAEPQWAPASGTPASTPATASAGSRRRAEPRHRRPGAPHPAAQPVPAAAPTMAVQAPARTSRNGGNGRNGAPAPDMPVPWVTRGPAPAPNTRGISHENRPRDRAGAPAAPPARPPAGPTAWPPAPHTRPAPGTRPPVTPGMRPPVAPAHPQATAASARPPAPPARPARRPARPAAPPAEAGQRPGWATRARPGTLGDWQVPPPGPGALEVAHAENGQPAKRAAAKPGWEPKRPGWEPKRPGWEPKRPAADGPPGDTGRNGTGSYGTGSVAPEHVVERGRAARPGPNPAQPASPAAFLPPAPPVGQTPPPGPAKTGPAKTGSTAPMSRIEAALSPSGPPTGQAPTVAPESAQPAGQPPPALLTPIKPSASSKPASTDPPPSGPPADKTAPLTEASEPAESKSAPPGPSADEAQPASEDPAPAPAQAQSAGSPSFMSSAPALAPPRVGSEDVRLHPDPIAGPATVLGPYRPPPSSTHSDQEQRDQARARMPLPGPRRIVIIGCTSGAGQTVTALLTARLLASLRTEPVGAIDLNPGDGSLAERLTAVPGSVPADAVPADTAPADTPPAETVPANTAPTETATAVPVPVGTLHDLLGGTLPVPPAPGIEVISAGGPGRPDFGRIGEQLAARYRISLIDPGASGVGPALAIADQLVLVAPASGDAPRAVSMTRNWLESHGHHELAANAVMVVNGVSSRSLPHVEEAEAIVVGRCRAIVRVPWEDQLGAGASPGTGTMPLRRPARQAITELAGVLVSGLAAGPGVQR